MYLKLCNSGISKDGQPLIFYLFFNQNKVSKLDKQGDIDFLNLAQISNFINPQVRKKDDENGENWINNCADSFRPSSFCKDGGISKVGYFKGWGNI